MWVSLPYVNLECMCAREGLATFRTMALYAENLCDLREYARPCHVSRLCTKASRQYRPPMVHPKRLKVPNPRLTGLNAFMARPGEPFQRIPKTELLQDLSIGLMGQVGWTEGLCMGAKLG